MPDVIPCLWFDRMQALEAVGLYTSLIRDSRIRHVHNGVVDGPGGRKGEPLMVEFTLAGRDYLAINTAERTGAFTQAVSFMIACEDQAEVDRLWAGLGEGGVPQPCGWLQDRWGLSWQITPKRLMQLVTDPDPARAARVTQAMYGMTKIDIAALERAARG